MKKLIEYLLQFGSLNQQQVELIEKKGKETELKKETYFSEAGRVAQQVGFLTNGVVRLCYFNNKGQEITRCFIDENNFVVDLNSFLNQIPSAEYIQAVTDCKLIVFSKAGWNDLFNTIIGWDAIVGKMIAKALIQKMDNISSLVSEDATTSYLAFMEKYPHLVNLIPLSYVASYLGITQSSLSRIRKNIR